MLTETFNNFEKAKNKLKNEKHVPLYIYNRTYCEDEDIIPEFIIEHIGSFNNPTPIKEEIASFDRLHHELQNQISNVLGLQDAHPYDIINMIRTGQFPRTVDRELMYMSVQLLIYARKRSVALNGWFREQDNNHHVTILVWEKLEESLYIKGMAQLEVSIPIPIEYKVIRNYFLYQYYDEKLTGLHPSCTNSTLIYYTKLYKESKEAYNHTKVLAFYYDKKHAYEKIAQNKSRMYSKVAKLNEDQVYYNAVSLAENGTSTIFMNCK